MDELAKRRGEIIERLQRHEDPVVKEGTELLLDEIGMLWGIVASRGPMQLTAGPRRVVGLMAAAFVLVVGSAFMVSWPSSKPASTAMAPGFAEGYRAGMLAARARVESVGTNRVPVKPQWPAMARSDDTCVNSEARC